MQEYKVASWNCEYVIEETFNNLINNEGWVLYGGVSIAVDKYGDFYFAQALTRDISNDDN